jgi:hypothetical protein
MGLLDQLGGDALAKVQELLGKQDGGQLSDQDAHDLHESVAAQSTQDDYHAAAHEAVSALTPEQQQELHTHLSTELQAQGHDAASLQGDHAAGSPGGLAGILTQLQHGGIGGVLNALGGVGGLMKNPLVAMVVGAIGGQLAKKAL